MLLTNEDDGARQRPANVYQRTHMSKFPFSRRRYHSRLIPGRLRLANRHSMLTTEWHISERFIGWLSPPTYKLS